MNWPAAAAAMLLILVSLRMISSVARSRGFDIAHAFTDPGISGGKPIRQRPGGAKAIHYIELSQRTDK
ncbi:MAG: hypothetical protein HXY38_16040, partial [Chloroflexi bacterium]|nr:hypothetical protein [Chloroflexota bacterium]